MHLFVHRNAERTSPAHAIPTAASVISGLGGLLVLVGWLFHLPALIQLRPGMAPMQFNSALCFVCAGAALYCWAEARFALAIPILAGGVALLGGLTLCEYLFRISLSIDQFFYRCSIVAETSNPGRMSPVSAVCFTLIGAALIILGLRAPRRWQPLVIGSLGSVVISISVVALFGYGSGLPGTYGWGRLTQVAPHTAMGLGVLGVGLFAAGWHLGTRPEESAPRWLPVPLALGVFTVTLVLYFALESKQDQEVAQTVSVAAENVKALLAIRMDARLRSFVRMARHWEFTGTLDRATWEDDASNCVRDFPDLEALEWVDPEYVVRWVVPLVGNEKKLDLELGRETHRNAAIRRAGQEHQPVITPIVPLFHGGEGFVIYVPITISGQPRGYLGAVFNAKTCFQRYLPAAVAAGQAITLSQGDRVFFERDATPHSPSKWRVSESLELHGATWGISVQPTPALVARLDSPLPEVVLGSGLLLSLLFAAATFFAQRYSRLAGVTARANLELLAALDQVKTLEGLLPICSHCKRVRDDTGYWNQIDTYLHKHTNASLSHGYCPECAAKACVEFGIDVPEIIQEQLDAGNFEARRE